VKGGWRSPPETARSPKPIAQSPKQKIIRSIREIRGELLLFLQPEIF